MRLRTAVLVCMFGAAVGSTLTVANSPAVLAGSGATLRAHIAYAVDGDTVRVREASGDLAYVRLVGIDTPEDVKPGYPAECGSRAAATSMSQLAPEGASVTLRYDPADFEDRYGRVLAHGFVGGRQLELAQLRRGWAYVYRYNGSDSRAYLASKPSRTLRALKAAEYGVAAAPTSTRLRRGDKIRKQLRPVIGRTTR